MLSAAAAPKCVTQARRAILLGYQRWIRSKRASIMLIHTLHTLEDLIVASRNLHQAMIDEVATKPEAVAVILDQQTPSFSAADRCAVMRLAAATAGYVATVLDEAMPTAMDSARWTHTIAAVALQDRWVNYDLQVCLGDHPDDPGKVELRNREIEYLRASLAGVSANTFGRLFQDQLVKPAVQEQQHDVWTPS